MLVRLLGRLVGGTMLLASASAAGVPGKDFFYYYGNNSAAPRAEGVGATLSTWHQTSPSVPTDAIAFGPPTITKITLPPGGSWPGVGQSYHLSEDAYYVVVAGEARLPGLDNGTTFKSGDWMWGMAGVTHGPVTAAPGSAANLTILAVGTALDARVGGAPVNFSNPTVDQDRSHARRRACQYRDGGLGCDYSGPHTADRVTWGAGGQAPCADSPGHPEGSCLQPHYHPRGAPGSPAARFTARTTRASTRGSTRATCAGRAPATGMAPSTPTRAARSWRCIRRTAAAATTSTRTAAGSGGSSHRLDPT